MSNGRTVIPGYSPPAVPGLKWHAVVYIFQYTLFSGFFLAGQHQKNPTLLQRVAVAEEQTIGFLKLFYLICPFFGFSSGSSRSRSRGFLVTMSQDTGLFSIKRPREVCDSR